MGYYEQDRPGYSQNILDIDFVIEAGFTLVRRNLIIDSGVELLIEDGGEFFVL